MPDDLDTAVAAIAADRESGASDIHERVLRVLSAALAQPERLQDVGRSLLRAQPSMASIWTAVARALAADAPASFGRYVEVVSRSGRSAARYATELLATDAPVPLRLVTLSYSGTVLTALSSLAKVVELRVSCAEGQPALEGRRLAARLSEAHVAVDYYTDAALAHAVSDATAVLVGADAVTPQWILNKSGTRMLAAVAGQVGVPVYVLATRDKFVSEAVGARLMIRDGAAAEVWASPPEGVTVHNPYFERVPLDLVTAVISDMGVLGAAMVPDACPTTFDDLLLKL